MSQGNLETTHRIDLDLSSLVTHFARGTALMIGRRGIFIVLVYIYEGPQKPSTRMLGLSFWWPKRVDTLSSLFHRAGALARSKSLSAQLTSKRDAAVHLSLPPIRPRSPRTFISTPSLHRHKVIKGLSEWLALLNTLVPHYNSSPSCPIHIADPWLPSHYPRPY